MMLLNADVISGGVIKAKDIFARRKKTGSCAVG